MKRIRTLFTMVVIAVIAMFATTTAGLPPPGIDLVDSYDDIATTDSVPALAELGANDNFSHVPAFAMAANDIVVDRDSSSRGSARGHAQEQSSGAGPAYDLHLNDDGGNDLRRRPLARA